MGVIRSHQLAWQTRTNRGAGGSQHLTYKAGPTGTPSHSSLHILFFCAHLARAMKGRMIFTKSFAPAGIFLAFGQATAALNLTFSGKDCPSNNEFSSVTYFNATSTTKFSMEQLGPHITEPWYYILTFADERGSKIEPFIHRWLSVPKSFWDSRSADDTPVCPFTLTGIKKSPKGREGNETCQGVVADKCSNAFADVEDFTVGASKCPSGDAATACGTGGLVYPGESPFCSCFRLLESKQSL